MIREPHVPMFLWIATAILAHIFFAGGADRTSKLIEERLDIQRFAASVQRYVRGYAEPVEVALLYEDDALAKEEEKEEEEEEEEEKEEEEERAEADQQRLAQRQEKKADLPKLEPEKPAQQAKPEEPGLDQAKPKKRKKTVQILEIQRDRRIAARQHVKDKNQKDNPNAEFIGNDANWVKEQTQARITTTDQNDPNPTPGGHHLGPTDNPGNADESRVGQSEDAPGDPSRTPTPLPEPPKVAAVSPPTLELIRPKPRTRPPARKPAPQPAQPEEQARAATKSVERAPDKLTSPDGTFTIRGERVARPAEKARPARKKRLPPRRRRLHDLLGLGASGRTDSGVSLNLTPEAAVAAVGRDQLKKERQADGERRRTVHRGSWKKLGIERWRGAIENYVSHVKPGNQTALNTARVPFANYLNHIHNRIHPVFADTFLVSLNSLPSSHPMNRHGISTNLEIVVSSVDGQLVKMGVTKTSGVTAFDIGALESVQRASPFGRPPREIISPDGNVYLHWEFHRNPYYACSTYFARPYILKTRPKTAPPRVKPPRRNPFRPKERPPPDEHRRGKHEPASDETHALGKASHAAVHRRVPSG